MASHNEKGEQGELIATDFLRRKGYKIIRQNWRYRHKEIDIIALDKEELVIVEVKLRSTDYFGDPSEAVTLKKQRFLIDAAEAYLDTREDAPEVRFDIVTIIDNNGDFEIEHITDAFSP
jgi:putative endonuclease